VQTAAAIIEYHHPIIEKQPRAGGDAEDDGSVDETLRIIRANRRSRTQPDQPDIRT